MASLPEEQRRPQGDASLEAWVGDRVRALALQRVLEQRAAAAGLEEAPEVEVQARFAANVELGKELVRRRCPAPEVEEADVRRAWEAAFPREPRPWILVRHVFKRLPADAAPAERARVRRELDDIHRRLEAGASFIDLARQHSDSATADDGGLIGRISHEAPMDPGFLAAAWALEDGEISAVVTLADGLHIILREGSGVEEPMSLEEASPRLRRQLAQRQVELCGRSILAELATATPVRFPESLPIRPQESDVLLWIGEEEITAEQVAALIGGGAGLEASPRSLAILKQFAEAELLGRAAREESEELAAAAERLSVSMRRRLATERQWATERRELVERWPEERLRDDFERHRERFDTELEVDLGLILLPPAAQRGERDTVTLAHRLAERAAAGEPFEDLAAEHSAHPSGAEGGRLGMLPWSRVRALFGGEALGALGALGVGEVSEPLLITRVPARTYGVVKLYERVEPRKRSFDEARDDVVGAVVSDEARALTEQVEASVLDGASFELHSRAVESFAAALTAPAGTGG
jgi:parvulin-like peptidyl-prolyl isomerase